MHILKVRAGSVDALDRPFHHKRGENAVTDKRIPSPEELRKLLRYEPETGKLFWYERPRALFETKRHFSIWNVRYAGKEAFTAIDRNGYKYGSIHGVLYRAHRVIWAIQTGQWPLDQVDHINRSRTDNRWFNLREATNTENCRNVSFKKTNTSGIKGVSWNTKLGRWVAQISCDRKKIHLGYYYDINDAAAAYATAAKKYHGDFSRLE